MSEELKSELSQSKELEKENEESIKAQRLDEILERVGSYRGGDPSDALTDEDKVFLDTEGYGINGYCQYIKIRTDLRRMFPNSYFYYDFYDESIIGVDLQTGSIIYELQELGYLHTKHVEGHSGGLNDRLECGGIVANRMSRLTPEDLQGKVPPTVIIIDRDMEHYEHLRGYLFYEHIGGVLADGL